MMSHENATPRNRRLAFTLIEILVVVSIIGVLIALLLPAVQHARESARKSQCANNLKQLGLATHNYLDTCQAFPPGYVSTVLEDHDDGGPGWAWSAILLPYFEEHIIYRHINPDKSVGDPVSETARMTSLPTFICPSDGGFETMINIPAAHGDQVICQLAAASYVASAARFAQPAKSVVTISMACSDAIERSSRGSCSTGSQRHWPQESARPIGPTPRCGASFPNPSCSTTRSRGSTPAARPTCLVLTHKYVSWRRKVWCASVARASMARCKGELRLRRERDHSAQSARSMNAGWQ